MQKHYKAFGISLLVLTLIVSILFCIKPIFSPRIDYQWTVIRYAKKYDLEPALIFAVIKAESNFDPKAHSSKDAYGLMQITEETLRWAILKENENAKYTAGDLYDPKVNIKYGCLILSLFTNEFRDQATILAAYNAGRGNIQKWLKDRRYSKDGHTIYKTPYKETNNYIEKVQHYYKEYCEILGEQT